MRTNQFVLKPLKSAVTFAVIVLLSVSLAPATTTGNNAQDLTFRLMNIERKLDQLQIRVDSVERAFQSQALSNTGSSNVSTQAMLELQRQQLSMAEQLVTMQPHRAAPCSGMICISSCVATASCSASGRHR